MIKWIEAQKETPPFHDEMSEVGFTGRMDYIMEISKKVVVFLSYDDQYRMGWFLSTVADGEYWEIEGLGDASKEDVVAWLPIPDLTNDYFTKPAAEQVA